MTSFLLAVLALGLAGIDPLGALLVGASLAVGATRPGALAFTVSSAVVTIGLGCAASLFLEPLLGRVDLDLIAIPDSVWVALNVVLTVVLALWGLRRALRAAPSTPPSRSSAPSISSRALLVAGVLFAFTALTDPTYYGVIVLAGRDEPVWLVVIAHVVWFLISQSPLLAVTTAAIFGAHRRIVDVIQGLWARARPVIGKLVTGAIFVAAAVLATDTVWYLTSGHFLIG